MPEAFVKFNSNARCIIDCSDFFTEQLTTFQARAATWSNYKRHNPVKSPVGKCQHGVITFVSPVFGGRVSDIDKEISILSGFLGKLTHGDVVLADHGFVEGSSHWEVQHSSVFITGKEAAFPKGG